MNNPQNNNAFSMIADMEGDFSQLEKIDEPK
jgi:hypothetical protein